MRWQKNTRGLYGDYVVWYRGGEFRALEFQLFEGKGNENWLSFFVCLGRKSRRDEWARLHFPACVPPVPTPHYSTLLRLAQYRERESGDSLLSRDLLSCAWPGNNNNFWNQKFLSFSPSSLATQKGQQNHNTAAALLCVYGSIFSIANGNHVIECSTCRVPCFKRKQHDRCVTVLIYIPSLNRNIVSFSTLRVMLLLLLLLLSSHRLKMETKGMIIP